MGRSRCRGPFVHPREHMTQAASRHFGALDPSAGRAQMPVKWRTFAALRHARGRGPMRRFESRMAVASGALAVGALAIGALAIGTIAIGSLAIKRASVLDARLRSLSIDEMSIGHLQVERLTVSRSVELPGGTAPRERFEADD